MFKFGKTPPRSLESFGVAGLIDENGFILYESLFSTKNIGRVSDLLSARLQKAGADELRLRALLTFSLMQSCRAQAYAGKWDAPIENDLAEPIIVEVGLDDTRLAMGVSFTCATEEFLKAEGLAARLTGGTPGNEFEKVLVAVMGSADRLVIRVQPHTRRFEVVALLGLPGKMDLKSDSDSPAPEVVILGKAPKVAPKIKEYVELGDLDYVALLKTGAGAAVAQALTGDEIAQVVRGVVEEANKQVVRGQAETQDKTKMVVQGQAAAPDASVVTVGGQASLSSQSELKYQAQIATLQAKVAQLEKERSEATTVFKATTQHIKTDDSRIEVKGGGGFGGLLKKIWPFKASLGAEEAEEVAAGQVIVASPPSKHSEGAAVESEDAATMGAVGDPETAVHDLAVAVDQGSLETTIKEVKKKREEVSGKMSERSAKNLLDEIAKLLLAEQAKLKQMAKKVTLSIRQKEMELKTKATTAEMTVRDFENQVRMKEGALEQQKEQIASLSKEVDRLREVSSETAKEGHFKKKFDHIQNLYIGLQKDAESTRKEVTRLKKALEMAQKPDSKTQALDKAKQLAQLAKDEMEKMRVRMEHKDKEVADLRAQLMEMQKKMQDRRAG